MFLTAAKAVADAARMADRPSRGGANMHQRAGADSERGHGACSRASAKLRPTM